MIRLFAAACVLLAATAAGFPDERKITVAEAALLLACMEGLDGYQVVVKAGAAEQIVTRAYEFGSGALRMKIADNIAVLREIAKTTIEAKNKIFLDVAQGDAEIKPATPKWDEYNRQVLDLLNSPAPGADKLGRIKSADLKLDRNEIPSSVIANCGPILDK